MPELPEVQTVVNGLIQEKIVGLRIVRAVIACPSSLVEVKPAVFCEQITDHVIEDIVRKGKYIVMQLGPFALLIHLRMSGRLFYSSLDIPLAKHERARLYLEGGKVLQFIDPRKFGRWYWLADPSQRLGKLGIDPTLPHFTVPYLQTLMNRKTQVKPLLLDQSVISGLGNIYVDEALWLAKIHPQRRANSLLFSELQQLQSAIQSVLHTAIEHQGTSLGHHPSNFRGLKGKSGENIHRLCVYRRTGFPCFRCHAPLTRIKIQARSSHFCPQCQQKNNG